MSALAKAEEVAPNLGSRPWIIKKLFPTGYWWELKATFNLAWAIVLTQITNVAMQSAATMIGGHLGKIELDAIALANTLINIMGYSVAIGAATACDTTFSQTFGSGNLKMVGVYLQKGLVIISLIMCVTLALTLNVEWLLRLIGQDPDVSRLVGQYLLIYTPGFLLNSAYNILRKYLQCQDVVYPHVIIGVAGLGVNILLQYLFLYQADMGIPGSSLAQVIGNVVLLLGTLFYTLCSGIYKDTWPGWTWRCLEDWGNFFRLAVFGILMVCFEWWAFEVITVLAGVLGTVELGAFGVIFKLDALLYSIPLGIGTATCIRVGQFLGAGQPKFALSAYSVGMSIVTVTSLVAAVLFVTLRWEYPKLFTNDPDVIALAAVLLPMTAVYTFFNSASGISRGVFQGVGRQSIATVVIFVTYYIVAMPVGIPLMFLTPLGLQGMWGAMCGSVILMSFVFFFILFGVFDWDKLSEQAKLRAGVMEKERTTSAGQKAEESTPLLENSDGHRSSPDGRKTPSFSTPTDPGSKLGKSLLAKRALTILSFLGILALGIVLRVALPEPSDNSSAGTVNSTDVLLNSTQQTYTTVSLL